jgi:hypothetical protein
MTVRTVFETDLYSFDYDRLAGVGWYVRKADDHVSLTETGIECAEIVEDYDNYSNAKPEHIQSFNEIAEKQLYSPRWGD